MKFFPILLLYPLALNAKLLEPILVGGSTSPWGTFPSAAFLTTSTLRYCGAAVIHPEFVLTLAQCVHDVEKLRLLNTTEIEIIAGDINIVPSSYDRQTRDVREVIVHPNYTVHNHRNDLALVRVGRPFQLPSNTVDVVQCRRRIVPNGAYCVMPGWGLQRGVSRYCCLQWVEFDEEDHYRPRWDRQHWISATSTLRSSIATCATRSTCTPEMSAKA